MVRSALIKSHFINSLIWRGRKVTAENYFAHILFSIKNNSSFSPLSVFYYAMSSLRPMVFLRPVRIGSVSYRAPAPISGHRQRMYAIKFVMQSARDSRGSITLDRVGALLYAVYVGNKNPASDKKFSFYEEALDNRSFTRNLKRL